MSPSGAFRTAGAALGAAVVLLLLMGPGGLGSPVRAEEASPDREGAAAGDKLPRLGKTGVLVPWEDFKKILEEIRGGRPTPTPPTPPVDFALSACQASVSVNQEESRAQVRLEFAVEILARDKWAEVPVIAEGVALSRFDIDGRPANVYRKNGYHQVALKGEGRHAFVLEYLAPVSDSHGSHSAFLRFPTAPVIAVDLVVPRPKLDFEIPGAVVRSIESGAGQSRVRAALQQSADAPVSWFKQIELGEKETKVFGEVRTLLSIGEGMVRGTATASYTVHGRGVDRFRVALPAGLNVLDVSAQGMRDWKVETGAPKDAGPSSAGPSGAGRVLAVSLNYLAQGNYEFQVSFEQEIDTARAAVASGRNAAPPGPPAAGLEGVANASARTAAGPDTSAVVQAPDLALLDVVRDKGFIAVSAASNVEINPEGELRNASPVDPSELPPDIAALAGQPVLYGFKYLRHPVEINLKVVRHDDLAVKRTIVQSARLFTFLSPEGHLITSARYTVKNNRKQYLEMSLPEGAEPWGAYLEDRPVKAARSAAGKVLVPLKKSATDSAGDLPPFEVELVYFQERSAGLLGRRLFRAPSLDVDAMEVQWNLFLPRDRRYGSFGGNLKPDDQLNHLVYMQGAAFNLRSGGDLAYLDGAGSAGDKNRSVKDEEAGAASPELQGMKKNVNEKADRLESDLKEIAGRDRRSDAQAKTQAVGGPQGGIVQSITQAWNYDARPAAAFAGGGMARGVLPVRFSVPTEGVRVSFAGRLLTANEEATIAMLSWPLAWSLSRAMVFFLALALTLFILWLRASPASPGSPLSGGSRLALSFGAAAVLGLQYTINPEARAAFWMGLMAAVAGFLGLRTFRHMRGAPALIVLALLGPLTGAAMLAASARPAYAIEPPRHDLPELRNTEITLAWSDFKALVEKTFVPPVVEPQPPSEGFLRSAEYSGRLEPGVLTLDGVMSLEVLKKGWIRLPLTSDGTVLAFQGGGAVLDRTNGSTDVLARGPASYTLRATFAFPATKNPGENRIAVRLPEAPRNLVDLGAAPMFKDLQVESGLAYGSRQGRLFVALPNGGLALRYTLPFKRTEEKAGQEVKLDPRVQLEGYQLLRLGDGVMGGALIHDYTVRVAKVDHFDIDLPEGLVIFDATAPALESWKILERTGRRFLRVKLLAPVEGRVRVIVNFEGTYDAKAGKLPVPRFASLGVERESGFVGVAAEGSEVDLDLTGRLLPADVSEIPQDVLAYGGNLVAACKYSGPPDAASVRIAEHEDAPVLTAVIESLNATAALLENGTEATWVDLSLKNNRRQFLALTLPGEDVDIWSLMLDGQPAKPKRTGQTVLVPLPRGDGERTSRVSLVLLRKGKPVGLFRRIEPRLPRFDIPVSEALWTVYLPEGNRYVVSGGPFHSVVETAPLLRGEAQARGGLLGFRGGGGEMMPARKAGSLAIAEDAASVPSNAPASPAASEMADALAPMEEKSQNAYGKAVSGQTAQQQMEQEGRVEQQLRQKAAVRKGSLPVHIAIPGGVARLPRVTVSRMLIVGQEDNTFSVRAYPEWLGALLGLVQPALILGAGILLGLALAGVVARNLLQRGALPAALLALLPWGGVTAPAALFVMVGAAFVTWAGVILYRRYRPATS